MNQTQNIALDSCVVIDIMEKPGVAKSLKSKLRGKSVKIILCDVVLGEVKRVRGYVPEKIISKISLLLGRKIELSASSEQSISNASQLSSQFQICHNGDNKILSLCQAKDFVLVTFDKMLLKTCSFVGVAAFHPAMAGGI
jgi:predicted nucleic acid-binding protein